MSTADEMRAIRAIYARQGVQEALPLLAAGYREPDPASPSWPFKPIPLGGASEPVKDGWVAAMLGAYSEPGAIH